MRSRIAVLLVAALAAAAGCRSFDPVLVRVELPSPTLFPADTVAAIIVADFRDEAPIPDVRAGVEFGSALKADLERAAPGPILVIGAPPGQLPPSLDDPAAWRAAGAGCAPGTVFLAGSLRLEGEIRKALDRNVPAGSPFETGRRALVAKRLWVLAVDLRVISAATGEPLHRAVLREEAEYAELDKPAEFALHELAARVRNDVVAMLYGTPTIERRALLRRPPGPR